MLIKLLVHVLGLHLLDFRLPGGEGRRGDERVELLFQLGVLLESLLGVWVLWDEIQALDLVLGLVESDDKTVSPNG